MKTSEVERRLFDLEKRYWRAIQTRDDATIQELTDDPCLVTGASGVGRLDRQAITSMLSEAGYELEDFRLEEPQVRMLGRNVAVLAYKVHEDLTVDGRRMAIDAADASTWVRRGDGWVCALHTESLLGDPFGRDRVH